MGTANTRQVAYLAHLNVFKKRYQETEDPEEKRRLGSLLDGEEDSETLIDCTKELKTEAAKELHGRAARSFITKHVLNLSVELMNNKLGLQAMAGSLQPPGA